MPPLVAPPGDLFAVIATRAHGARVASPCCSVAPATAARLTGTAVSALASPRLVLTEAGLARVAVIDHGALGEVAALVRLDARATSTTNAEHEYREPSDEPHGRRTISRGPVASVGGAVVHLAHMKRLSALLLALAACGGTQDGSTTPGGTGPGGGSGSQPGVAGDGNHELDAFEVKGLVFEPQGLGRPGMPRADAKKKTTIEKQRAVVAKEKDPVIKQAQAAVLSTLIFDQIKTSPDKEKEYMTEARQVLRDSQAAAGKDVDEVTLRLLASYEIYFQDWPAAEAAWAAYIAKTPKSKSDPYNRAWWAYALLMQGKNAEALEVVKNQKLDEKESELAYVTAWAKFRANDDAGAWQAIVTAAKQWTGESVPIQRDIYLFASRSSLAFTEVMPQLFDVFNAKQPATQYAVVAKLGLQAYEPAGKWAEGVAALEKALAIIGTAVPVDDVPTIRYKQAEFTGRLDTPEVAAKFATQAINAMPACGTKCTPQQNQNLILGIAGMARYFHYLYATANDIRYYQPANDLYLAVIPLIMDQATRTEYNNGAAALQQTLKNTKVGTGNHEKQAVRLVVDNHRQEVSACYEAALVGSPKLSGTLSLTFEIETAGSIKGIATEPKAGLADMSSVAGCVAEHAKLWKFPKRGSEGTTRVKATYNLVPTRG